MENDKSIDSIIVKLIENANQRDKNISKRLIWTLTLFSISIMLIICCEKLTDLKNLISLYGEFASITITVLLIFVFLIRKDTMLSLLRGNILLSIWSLLAFSIILFLLFFHYKLNSINELLLIALMFTPLILVPLVFQFAITKEKKVTTFFYENLILFRWLRKENNTNTRMIYLSFRIILTSIYYVLILSAFLLIGILNENMSAFVNKYSGLFIVYGLFIFAFIFIIIVLPEIIQEKTKKNGYKYFYWLHFLKAISVNNPFTGVCVLLYILISVGICLYTIFFHQINIFSLVIGPKFGNVLSLISILMTAVLIVAQNIITSYSDIFLTYERYASHILRERILYGGKFKYNLIGLGNLGKVICGSLLYNSVRQVIEDGKRKVIEPLKYFEFIVDRNLNIRIIPRNIIVIEKNQLLFEETRFERESGLIYGFANGKELLLLDKFINIKDNKKLDHLGVFCLNGDGGSLSILNLADYGQNRIIFNTCSDPDMGLKLKLIFNKTGIINLPSVISTVEDSSTDSFLEINHNSIHNFYTILANQIEGNSIAVRLFMTIRNILENKDSKDINTVIFLLGSSKTLYYVLYNLRHYLKLIFEDEYIKCFFEDRIYLITDEVLILNECIKVNEISTQVNHYKWDVLFDKIKYIMSVVYESPTNIHSINNAYEWFKNIINEENDSIPLFVYSTKQPHDAIRISQHIKQIQSMQNIASLSILASITDEILDSVEHLYKDYPPLKNFLDDFPGFPAELNDIILTKSRIISNQIISISNCLRNNGDISLSKEIKKKNKFQGKSVFCMSNEPGSLAKMISEISGLINFDWSENIKNNPSFFNNYSYSFKSEIFEDYKMFVFRGDAYLTEKSKSENNYIKSMFGFKGYGDEIFVDGLHQRLDTPQYTSTCKKYSTKCPLSQYSFCTDNDNSSIVPSELMKKDFATIKILANYDDLPGSLGVALSDFLMAGKKMKFNESFNKNPIVEISYHNSMLCCNAKKTICRLYGQLIELDAVQNSLLNNQIAEMLKERPIMGIKIKPSCLESEWYKYAEDLKMYFFNMNIDFELIYHNSVIILYNTKYQDIGNFKSFLEEHF